MSISILVVEDDLRLQGVIREVLEEEGFDVLGASTGSEAVEVFQRERPDIALLDVGLPDASGLDLLPQFKSAREDVVVVMITANAEIETAVTAMQRGADDFVTKPFHLDRFRASVRQAAEKVSMQRRLRRLVQDRIQEQSFIGKSRAVADLLTKVDRIARSGGDATVLIHGETGTGKELIAKRIHAEGPRASAPFFAENCANLHRELLEDSLFGHSRGAFTGATSDQPGLLELAADGTLFLDEIGEMSLDLQAKILRVLEERTFLRVGDHRRIEVRAQIVTATNRDLVAMVRDGAFREDLYFRLDVLPIEIPPLRHRGDDVALLLNHYLEKFNVQFGRSIEGFSPSALDILRTYQWPGNVRELRNMMERLVILWDGGSRVGVDALPSRFVGDAGTRPLDTAPGVGAGAPGTAGIEPGGSVHAATPRLVPLETIESEHLNAVYEWTGRNKAETARILGITRQTVQKKLEKLPSTDHSERAEPAGA